MPAVLGDGATLLVGLLLCAAAVLWHNPSLSSWIWTGNVDTEETAVSWAGPLSVLNVCKRNLPFRRPAVFFGLCFGFSISSFENDMCTLRKGHRRITCGEFSTVLCIHRNSWTLSSSLKTLVNLVYWVKHVWKNFNQKESRSFTVVLIKIVALVRYETYPLCHLFHCLLER